MAESEDKDGKQQEEKKEKKSGGTLKLILMIGLPLIMLQTGLAYFIISKAVHVPAAEEGADEPEEVPETPGMLHTIADVIVNPAGTGGVRFVNLTIGMEYTDPELEQELIEKEVQLRDALINILSGKTIDELDSPEDKELLRQEILEQCNARLKGGKLRRVYFSNFVMQ